MQEDLRLAYRKSGIYEVITHKFGTVSPDILEQVEHDPDGLVPYQSSISLEFLRKLQFRQPTTYLRKGWSGDRPIPFPFLSF